MKTGIRHDLDWERFIFPDEEDVPLISLEFHDAIRQMLTFEQRHAIATKALAIASALVFKAVMEGVHEG